MISTGIGKKELSAKDTTAKAGIAFLCRASALVFSYHVSRNLNGPFISPLKPQTYYKVYGQNG